MPSMYTCIVQQSNKYKYKYKYEQRPAESTWGRSDSSAKHVYAQSASWRCGQHSGWVEQRVQVVHSTVYTRGPTPRRLTVEPDRLYTILNSTILYYTVLYCAMLISLYVIILDYT